MTKIFSYYGYTITRRDHSAPGQLYDYEVAGEVFPTARQAMDRVRELRRKP